MVIQGDWWTRWTGWTNCHFVHLIVAPGISQRTVEQNSKDKGPTSTWIESLLTQTMICWWAHWSAPPNHILGFGDLPKLIRMSDLTLVKAFSEKWEGELTKPTIWPHPFLRVPPGYSEPTGEYICCLWVTDFSIRVWEFTLASTPPFP